jgi:hypothetical protein
MTGMYEADPLLLGGLVALVVVASVAFVIWTEARRRR